VSNDLVYKNFSLMFSSPKNTLAFVGPCSHRDRDYRIGSNFWKLYLIRIGFALGEPVSLVKVFRLEWVFYEDYKAYEREGSFTYSLRVTGILRLLIGAR
jgi:hypothetical protein